jgi:hypothetical protein
VASHWPKRVDLITRVTYLLGEARNGDRKEQESGLPPDIDDHGGSDATLANTVQACARTIRTT